MDLVLREALDSIAVGKLDYREWVTVGMALKEIGEPCEVWDRWSARGDARFSPGECARKWRSFKGGGTPVGAGSIIAIAKAHGWQGNAGHAMEWGDAIHAETQPYTAQAATPPPTAQPAQHAAPLALDLAQHAAQPPAEQISRYLRALFEPDEYVALVTESYQNAKGKICPAKGFCDRTAAQLLAELDTCGGDVGKVLGDANPDVGAWVCFNPVDGQGRTDANITSYRYALVESDSMSLDEQAAAIRKLELPCAALVYSGGKSLHAIVRVDAPNEQEYRSRVDTLYSACAKAGLEIDQQNRNPARLSRLPGIPRKGQMQCLIDTDCGKSCWAEWAEWYRHGTDDLPDEESLAAVWDAMPPLADELIAGVLRKGHKMLLAGPSKAGKSFALIELCIAIAEGARWMGRFDCAQGKVLYINLELDRASCLHRFRDVYRALDIPPQNLQNIVIWNLRGSSVPMDKLAPMLIRRAAQKNYTAVVLDPIYKVITGDENSADQMAAFCNQFDVVCKALGCAVIYCHHHSKGAQGGKRSMDRASGSGVFARDPDALLDLCELTPTDAIREQLRTKAACRVIAQTLDAAGQGDAYNRDDACSRVRMLDIAREHLSMAALRTLDADIEAASKRANALTAWRVEGTLREFARFSPVNLWFDYPVHKPDIGLLEDLDPDMPNYSSMGSKGAAKRWGGKGTPDKTKQLSDAYEACTMDGEVTIYAMAQYLDLKPETVKKRLRADGGYWIDGEKVGRKEPGYKG